MSSSRVTTLQASVRVLLLWNKDESPPMWVKIFWLAERERAPRPGSDLFNLLFSRHHLHKHSSVFALITHGTQSKTNIWVLSGTASMCWTHLFTLPHRFMKKSVPCFILLIDCVLIFFFYLFLMLFSFLLNLASPDETLLWCKILIDFDLIFQIKSPH